MTEVGENIEWGDDLGGIYAHGIDLVEIGRIKQALSRFDGDFLCRILTACEIEALPPTRNARFYEWVAGRFAAKEAIAKTLGCGIGRKLAWADMDIRTGKNGQPEVYLSENGYAALMEYVVSMKFPVSAEVDVLKLQNGKGEAIFKAAPCLKLSLTHTAELAMASCILTISTKII